MLVCEVYIVRERSHYLRGVAQSVGHGLVKDLVRDLVYSIYTVYMNNNKLVYGRNRY